MSESLKKVAIFILRYGLGFILIWLGFLKFKNFEAEYLQALIEQTVHLSWLLKVASPYVWIQIFAYIEMAAGLCIMLKPFSHKVSLYGGFVALFIFVINLSFLFTTSMVWQTGYGFPEMSKIGQSILKDIVLAGSALWCIGDSFDY